MQLLTLLGLLFILLSAAGCARIGSLFSDAAAIRFHIVGTWQGTATSGTATQGERFVFTDDGTFTHSRVVRDTTLSRAGIRLQGKYDIENGVLVFHSVEFLDAFNDDDPRSFFEITADLDSLYCEMEGRTLTALRQAIVLLRDDTEGDTRDTNTPWGRWISIGWSVSHVFRTGTSCVRTVITSHDFSSPRRRVVRRVETLGSPSTCGEPSREREYHVNFRNEFLEIIPEKGPLEHYRAAFTGGTMFLTVTQNPIILKKIGSGETTPHDELFATPAAKS